MAKGKISTINVVQNNKKNTVVSRTHEQVVVNGVLVDDNNAINPGVFSV